MTTPMLPQNVLLEVDPSVGVAPMPGSNQIDKTGLVSRDTIARNIVMDHQAGMASRREADLLAEKYLLHIDGSGDSQWADILDGARVDIPRLVSEYRRTENLLRLVVDNAVAHHTTMPLQYYAECGSDRRSREKSIVDTAFANYIVQHQDLNGLFADALYLAMPAGFCPVHRYWRDAETDQIAVVAPDGDNGMLDQLLPNTASGMIDCWLGNPFDTVFDRGARKGSIQWWSYGRVLPASVVRQAFAHVPGIEKLEGTTRMPSASGFQRIARRWRQESLGTHGSSVITHRRDAQDSDTDELMIIICKEIYPGVDARYPDGRLFIVALPGATELKDMNVKSGRAVLLADQPLPGRDFSGTLFYSHHRGDDVHGKPWVEDLDGLQVELNIALSKRWEFLNKMAEAPIVAPGGAISDDMAEIDGYGILEIDPSLAGWRPRVVEWPDYVLAGLDKEVADKRQAIYTGGGYQAVSRGENPGSRTPYRSILALQQADSSIHGPINKRFRQSATDFMVGCWKQMKAYGDVPWLIDAIGNEQEHLAEPYIDNTRLSDKTPRYKLVNAFGPTPELRAQELLELMQIRGADGLPLITTAEVRRLYPDQALFEADSQAVSMKKRRARVIASKIHLLAQRIRNEAGIEGEALVDPQVQQAAMQVFAMIEQHFPRLRDDDLQSHLDAMSEITQDETADTIARLAAMQRLEMLYQWQQMMSQGQPGQPQMQYQQKTMPQVQMQQQMKEKQMQQQQQASPTVRPGPSGQPGQAPQAAPQQGPAAPQAGPQAPTSRTGPGVGNIASERAQVARQTPGGLGPSASRAAFGPQR